jgi:site-specific DNA-methyltransferase (adenine-specific)
MVISVNDKVVLGDCLAVMKDLPDDCVDSIVCDPPAGIAFMGKEWDKDKGGRLAWVAWMESIATECLRVVKPGGYALVWALPRTSHWTGWAWENASWEPRDKLVHLFGSGFPKSLDVSKAIDKAAGAERNVSGSRMGDVGIQGGNFANKTKSGVIELRDVPATDAARQWNGWGTALKPAAEDWWLFRKPLSEGTVAANVLKYGTGGINIDGCRIETSDELLIHTRGDSGKRDTRLTYSGGDFPLIMERKATAGQALGRWPANVILDEEAAALLDEQTGKVGGGDKRSRGKANDAGFYNPGTETARDPSHAGPVYADTGVSRFFYTAKASRSERTHGGTVENKHPTVKPISLMRYLVRLVTPPGGSVLDPFCGSGSTLVAAELEGFDYLGIEQDPESHKTACERLANAEVLRKKTDPKAAQVATEEEP